MPTSQKKPLVIVTRKLPDAVETRMRELFEARLNVDDKPMSRADLAEAVKTAHVLVPTVTDRIDRTLLSQAGPQLKLIANFGNGVDNIDLDTARVRGIIVTNTPGVLTEDTADMTMALILAVPRRLAEGTALLKDTKQNWTGWSPTWMLGHRIWGKRLGIIGMGRIGQAVARRAKAFGLQIHYHNRRRVSEEIEQELEVTYWDSLDQMLARRGHRRERAGAPDRGRTDRRRRARRVRARARRQPEAAGERPGGGAAAHGIGHHRGAHRHGREGDHQRQDLPRRPQPARSRARGDVLTTAGAGGRRESLDGHRRAA
jgi:D-isomer specific 2-hydroxyacid dehydrogenase, catalytic domain/D-isomer specific 2-hydroxyacid dehydrogenase, NAD binding domain